MKKRKSFLSFFLLALVLFLGIGYAAVSNNVLFVKGGASAAQLELNVKFSGEYTTTKNGGTQLTSSLEWTDSSDKECAEINVEGLATLQDYVEFNIQVRNYETDLFAQLSDSSVLVKDANNENPFANDYYKVEASLSAGSNNYPSDSDEIILTNYVESTSDANYNTQFCDVVVRVSLKKIPITDVTASFTVQFTATPLAVQ